MNKQIKLEPSLWTYAIHSHNAELISILDENNVRLAGYHDKCIIESTKCHHNDFAKYFLDKYLNYIWYNEKCFLDVYLQYSNYEIIPIELDSYPEYRLTVEEIYNSIQNNTEFLDLLFRRSYININLKYPRFYDEKTILTFAIEKENIEVIKLLLSNSKIDPNIIIVFIHIIFMMIFITISYKTSLILAIEKNNIDIIQLLVSCPNIDLNIQIIIN